MDEFLSSLKRYNLAASWPGEQGYCSVVRAWGRPEGLPEPRATVHPTSVGDIQRFVTLVSEAKCDFAIRGAGHHPSGSSIATEGLVLDMSQFRSVSETADGSLLVGAGCIWSEVNTVAVSLGGIVPAGNAASTGVVGLALGGGLGPLSRSFGPTCDFVRAVHLVTPDAVIHRVCRQIFRTYSRLSVAPDAVLEWLLA